MWKEEWSKGRVSKKLVLKRKWSLIRSLAALTKSFDDVAQRVERFVDVGSFSDPPFVVLMVVGVGSLTETQSSLTETQQLSH